LNRFFRSALFPLIVIAALVWLATQTLVSHGKKSERETYSQLIGTVQSDPQSLQQVIFNPNKREITATTVDNKKIVVHYPSDQSQAQFQTQLEKKGVKFDSKGTGSSPWWSILTSLLPFVLLFGFWIFLMNQVQGGGSKVMSFGKSRAKRMTPDTPKIGFKDVAGVDEAVEELQEIKEFLENPKRVQALGARIPKGVLLDGPARADTVEPIDERRHPQTTRLGNLVRRREAVLLGLNRAVGACEQRAHLPSWLVPVGATPASSGCTVGYAAFRRLLGPFPS
jgi:cell division protease FtsH